jgi:hypothetical protein
MAIPFFDTTKGLFFTVGAEKGIGAECQVSWHRHRGTDRALFLYAVVEVNLGLLLSGQV